MLYDVILNLLCVVISCLKYMLFFKVVCYINIFILQIIKELYLNIIWLFKEGYLFFIIIYYLYGSENMYWLQVKNWY